MAQLCGGPAHKWDPAMQWRYCRAMAVSVDIITCLIFVPRQLCGEDGLLPDVRSYGVTSIRTVWAVSSFRLGLLNILKCRRFLYFCGSSSGRNAFVCSCYCDINRVFFKPFEPRPAGTKGGVPVLLADLPLCKKS